MQRAVQVFSGLATFIVGAGLGFTMLGPSPDSQAVEPTPSALRAGEGAGQPSRAPRLVLETGEGKAGDKTSEEPRCASACLEELGERRRTLISSSSKEDAELIEHLEQLLRRTGAAAPEGIPTPFPEELDESFTPQGFKALIERLQEKCPSLINDTVKVDCSEYPCVMSLRWKGGHKEWQEKRKACPEFEAFGERGKFPHIWKLEQDGPESIVRLPGMPRKGAGDFEHAEKWKGNLTKRNKRRAREQYKEGRESWDIERCDEGDGAGCVRQSHRLNDQPEEKVRLLQRGCELKDATACNNLAWERCHDQGECDEQALEAAELATELDPTNGQTGWDTLAYTLCEMGEFARSREAYKKSCELGYEKACSARCP